MNVHVFSLAKQNFCQATISLFFSIFLKKSLLWWSQQSYCGDPITHITTIRDWALHFHLAAEQIIEVYKTDSIVGTTFVQDVQNYHKWHANPQIFCYRVPWLTLLHVHPNLEFRTSCHDITSSINDPSWNFMVLCYTVWYQCQMVM